MPRPRKCRRVCSLPNIEGVAPIGETGTADDIVMSVEEYEVIRLIDWKGLTQEECAAQMEIARTTVTGIYMTARLRIDGGDFALCEHRTAMCGTGRACPCCKKRKSEDLENE